MNDRLALDILLILKKGESNGRHTVRNDIASMERHYEVTDTDFALIWSKLVELEFILTQRNPVLNNLRYYTLNPQKDGISIYEKKLQKLEETEVNNTEFANLTKQQLITQVTLLTDQAADYQTERGRKKTAYIISIILALATIISTWIAIAQYLKCK